MSRFVQEGTSKEGLTFLSNDGISEPEIEDPGPSDMNMFGKPSTAMDKYAKGYGDQRSLSR